MTTSEIKRLPAGINVPVVTFFRPTPGQELDFETHVPHIKPSDTNTR
jgi:hypothetical protein